MKRLALLVPLILPLAAVEARAKEYLHPKLTSGQVSIHTAIVLPARAVIVKVGVKGAESMIQESEDLEDVFSKLVVDALAERGVQVLPSVFSPDSLGSNALLRYALADLQSRYDAVAAMMYRKAGDVKKGRFSMGDEVAAFLGSETADALVFVRVVGRQLTGGKKAMGFLGGDYLSSSVAYLSLVDAKTGDVLFLSKIEAFGDIGGAPDKGPSWKAWLVPGGAISAEFSFAWAVSRAFEKLPRPSADAATLSKSSFPREVRLRVGQHAETRIGSPVLDDNQVAPLVVGEFSVEQSGAIKIVRGYGGMTTRGPSYELGPQVNLGALLAEALREQASAIGYRAALAADAEGAWFLRGIVKDIYLEATHRSLKLFMYGYMDVEFVLKGPDGAPGTARRRAHVLAGLRYQGGSRKDEAEVGVARFLIEGAQELLSQLNQDFFKAPPHSSIGGKLKDVASSGVEFHQNDLRLIGLSGSKEALPVLLSLLDREQDPGSRSQIIHSIALLGSPEAVPALVARYPNESPEGRWYTLKAMDRVGDEAALAVIRERGLADEDEACRRLAEKLLNARAQTSSSLPRISETP